MGADITVRELSTHEHDLWAALIGESPDGSIYSSPDYLDVLCAIGGGSFRLIGVWMGEELVGGVALYVQKRWYGRRAGPRLLLYYHSPVVRRYDTKYPSEQTARHVRILGALAEHLGNLGLAGVTLKCRSTLGEVRPFLAQGWDCGPSFTYVVPLTDLSSQWTRVEQNLRRLVKRGEKEGLAVTEDDDVATFHRLHGATMHRKDAGLYLERRAFRSYFQRLRGQNLCRLYHARLPDGTPVAGQLVLLGPGRVSHTVMAAADEAHLKLGASAFLRWKVFEELAGLGYGGNDLTDASLNSVTRFKSQFGGDLLLCHVLHRRPSRAVALAERFDEARWGLQHRLGIAIRRLRQPGGAKDDADADRG